MSTRLDIALEALREIRVADQDRRIYDACDCPRRAGQALAAIDAAPPEIVLTRDEALLCVRALDAAADLWVRSNVPDEVSEVTVADRLQDRLIAALSPAVKETK